jgi:hypothetical protein
MALSSNLTAWSSSSITDKAPLSPAYLNAKFEILDNNITAVNTTTLGTNVFHVEDPAYGAVGDNSTDDTAAINAAATAAIAAGGVLTATSGTTYRCKGAVDWSGLRYCDFTGAAIHSTYTLGPSITIGGTSGSFGVDNAILTMPILFRPQGGPDGDDGNPLPEGDGIQVLGLNHSRVVLQRIANCEKGLNVSSSTDLGVAYNDFFGPDIHDCVLAGIHVQPMNAGAFCNDNRVFGGNIRINSTYANEAGSTLIRMNSTGTSSAPNGWDFFGTTLEGAIASQLDIVHGAFNTWWGCRWESANTITFGASSDRNMIIGGTGALELKANSVISDSGTRNGLADPSVGFTVFPALGNLDNTGTPTVYGMHMAQLHNTPPLAGITDFDDGSVGQQITLVSASTTTLVHNTSSLRLARATDYVMGPQDTVTLLKTNAGAAWREISRTTV